MTKGIFLKIIEPMANICSINILLELYRPRYFRFFSGIVKLKFP